LVRNLSVAFEGSLPAKLKRIRRRDVSGFYWMMAARLNEPIFLKGRLFQLDKNSSSKGICYVQLIVSLNARVLEFALIPVQSLNRGAAPQHGGSLTKLKFLI
jgi:hypothetical protein